MVAQPADYSECQQQVSQAEDADYSYGGSKNSHIVSRSGGQIFVAWPGISAKGQATATAGYMLQLSPSHGVQLTLLQLAEYVHNWYFCRLSATHAPHAF